MSYYPSQIVEPPTMIIESNERVEGKITAEEIDLVAGGNIDVSSLSIDDLEVIDSNKNIKNIESINSNTAEFSDVIVNNFIELEGDAAETLGKFERHGNATSARMELYDSSSGTALRKVFITSNSTNNGYINMPFAFGTSGVMETTAQVQIDSTTAGFLQPRLTQTQNLQSRI